MKPAVRLASFFGAYFAYVGLFAPYLPLWLSSRGFTPAEIGVLISPMQWARVVGPPAWGWMADHAHGPHGVVRLLQASAALAVCSAGLLLIDLDFWPLFLALCLMSFFLSGQVPVTESLAMHAARGSMKIYGRMRLWGSIGFIVAVTLSGPLFDRVGIAWLPFTLLGMLGLILACAFLLPPREVHDLSPQPALIRTMLADRRIQRFLLASFLMLLAHAPLYTLFSLWLQSLGFTRTEIGLLWALGVIAEIAVFQFQHRLFERLPVGRCWVLAYGATVLRFLMIAFSAGSVPILIVAQLLHAVTFGIHHSASMSLIREWFPAQAQARGQALYTMASYGLGGSLGGIAAGWLWEAVSPEFSFVAAALAGLAGMAAAVWALRVSRMPAVSQGSGKA